LIRYLFLIHRWNATGVLDLNKTCTDDDVITFNGENYRQLCSPTIELGKIDSVRFTLSIGKLNLMKNVFNLFYLKNHVRNEINLFQHRMP
jgi:hypothetical protein